MVESINAIPEQETKDLLINCKSLLSKMCRVCAREASDLIPLYGISDSGLVDKVHCHLPILVSEEDILPLSMCESCIGQLEACHLFFNTCIAADQRLKELINCIENKEIKVVNKNINTRSMSQISKDRLILSSEQGMKTASNQVTVSLLSERTTKEKPLWSFYHCKHCDNVSIVTNKSSIPVFMCQQCDGIFKSEKLFAAHMQIRHKTKSFEKKDVKKHPATGVYEVKDENDIFNGNDSQGLDDSEPESPLKNLETESVKKGRIRDMMKQAKGVKKAVQRRSWECNKCGNVSNSMAEWKQHRTKHKILHGDKKHFICEFCGKAFRANTALKEHLASHGAVEFNLTCDHCGKGFATRSAFKYHSFTHLPVSPYLCDFCGKGFNHISNLNTHKKIHLGINYLHLYPCNVCGKKYQSRSRLKEHNNVHTGERPYQCDKCEKNFTHMSHLRQHLQTHTSLRKFCCPKCNSSFKRKGNMLAHAKLHEVSKKGGFSCKVCKQEFESKKELWLHRKTHTGAEIQESLKQRAAEGDKSACKCDICDKVLSSRLTLRTHMLQHSKNSLICEFCSKQFRTKQTLDYHKKTHLTGNPFPCHFCSESFLSRQELVNHEHIHEKEKPWKCNVCGMCFRNHSTLYQHKMVHSEDRPFKCQNCNKSFRRRDTLISHMRTHTGERPFACQFCGRRFKQRGDCSKHQRSHAKGTHLFVQNSEQQKQNFLQNVMLHLDY